MSIAAAQTPSGPTMSDEVSFISGIGPDGTVAPISFDTWTGGTPAQYGTEGYLGKWGLPTAGTPGGTVDYYFSRDSHWTAKEKTALASGLQLWSDVANIQFTHTQSKSAAEIIFVRGKDGSAYEQASTTAIAHAGSSTIPQNEVAHISIDTSVRGFGPIGASFSEYGGYPWDTLVHEEGHAIGLGHAGPYNGTVHTQTQQFSAYDSRIWSIMSYIDPSEGAKYSSQYPVSADWGDYVPETPMPLDILAAQRLYGAPTDTALSGGQTFGFNCNITDGTKPYFDFTVNQVPVVTLYDIGAHNRLDLSGYDTSSHVNLNAGTYSSCAGLTHNVAIAFDTQIDTAIGGSANDKLVANADGDNLWGGSGNDHLIGGDGHDVLNGQKGHDVLAGGDGNDVLNGGPGADVLKGGAGADRFVFAAASDSTGTHYDTISGFDPTQGDKIHLSLHVAALDNEIANGALSKASFNSDLAAAAGNLQSHHAVLFAPDSGSLSGHIFLIVDANGEAGYQPGADYVIQLSHASDLGQLTTANFS